jgi:hypothetical protein
MILLKWQRIEWLVACFAERLAEVAKREGAALAGKSWYWFFSIGTGSGRAAF